MKFFQLLPALLNQQDSNYVSFRLDFEIVDSSVFLTNNYYSKSEIHQYCNSHANIFHHVKFLFWWPNTISYELRLNVIKGAFL